MVKPLRLGRLKSLRSVAARLSKQHSRTEKDLARIWKRKLEIEARPFGTGACLEMADWPPIIANLRHRLPVETYPGLKVRFSVLPARAVLDNRIRGTALLVLAAIGLYVNREGIAYPGMRAIGSRISRHPSTVCRWIARLVKYGYLRRLEPKGARYPFAPRQTARYQLLVAENDLLPANELELHS